MSSECKPSRVMHDAYRILIKGRWVTVRRYDSGYTMEIDLMDLPHIFNIVCLSKEPVDLWFSFRQVPHEMRQQAVVFGVVE